MHKKLFFLFLLAVFLVPGKVFGQNKLFSDLCIDTRIHYGFLMPHHNSLRYLQKGHIPAINIKISKYTQSLFPWSSYYRKPDIGLAYYYADLQWDEVLGSVNAVYGFFSFPLGGLEFIGANYNVEMGLAFLSQHFDEDDNVYNIAIGSTTNFYFSTGIDMESKISKKVYLIGGLSLKHFSNGAVKKPNKGINLVQVNFGVKYNLSERRYLFLKDIPDRNKYYTLIIFGNIGKKQIYPSEMQSYFVSTGSVDFLMDYSNKKSVGLGFDVFYDESIRTRMEAKDFETDSNIDNVRQGIHVSYNTYFGRLGFTFQAGTYLFVNWNDDENIYSRLGLQYHYDKYIFNVNLKTHYGRADYIEWGIGYKLWQKEKN